MYFAYIFIIQIMFKKVTSSSLKKWRALDYKCRQLHDFIYFCKIVSFIFMNDFQLWKTVYLIETYTLDRIVDNFPCLL